MDTVPSLSILVPKLFLPYRVVAKAPLPEGLACFAIVLSRITFGFSSKVKSDSTYTSCTGKI